MDINEKSLNFQRKLVALINEQQEIPFLLKYFLIKEIWEQTERTKQQLLIQTTLKENDEKEKKEGEEQ